MAEISWLSSLMGGVYDIVDKLPVTSGLVSKLSAHFLCTFMSCMCNQTDFPCKTNSQLDWPCVPLAENYQVWILMDCESGQTKHELRIKVLTPNWTL